MTEPDRATNLPRTAQAALFLGAGQPLELCELPIPLPGPGEALVRVECCTVCGSDLHTLTGARQEATPTILGHEILGQVAAVGTPPLSEIDGEALQVGDRVTWSVAISCGSCDRCRGGLPQKCRSLLKYGHERADGRGALSGGLAEYVLLRSGTAAVRVDRELSAEMICPVNCATATVAAAYRVAGAIAGKSVLILGAGMLGLTAAALAQTLGAERIAVGDVNEQRLAQARRFGASHVAPFSGDPAQFEMSLRDVCGRSRFDVILELSGAVQAVELACQLGEIGGTVVLVGTVMTSPPAKFDPEQVVRKWLKICGVHNYAPEDLRTAVRFLETFGREFPFAELVAAKYPLQEVNQAVEFAIRERPIRVAICPEPWSL